MVDGFGHAWLHQNEIHAAMLVAFGASKYIILDIILQPKEIDHGLTFDICQVKHTHVLVDVYPLSLLCPYIPSKTIRNHYVVFIDRVELINADSTDKLI